MKDRFMRSTQISLAIIIIDQLTKWLMFFSNRSYVITSYISFELTYNRGISWGLFASHLSSVFFIVSLLIATLTGLLGVYAYIRYRKGKGIIPEVLIISGSCSNLLDRVIHGGVIDFIVLHYNNLAWPVFNIADVCVVLGVTALFVRQLKEHEPRPKV